MRISNTWHSGVFNYGNNYCVDQGGGKMEKHIEKKKERIGHQIKEKPVQQVVNDTIQLAKGNQDEDEHSPYWDISQ